MTSVKHKSGTDRIQEVATELQLSEDQILVNVQADEPLLPSSVINQVSRNLENHADVGIATLCEVVTSQDEIGNPHAVNSIFPFALSTS